MSAVDQIKIMDDIAQAVAVVNGMKMGLVNEGWDPARAEEAVIAQVKLGGKA